MTLKNSLRKNLRNKKAQSVVEYFIVFLVLTIGIIIVFGGFNLGDSSGSNSNLGIKSLFDQAVDKAIGEINR